MCDHASDALTVAKVDVPLSVCGDVCARPPAWRMRTYNCVDAFGP